MKSSVPPTVAFPAWQVLVTDRRTLCAQCRRVVAEGELVALHPVTNLRFHPSCAGIASGGDVVAPVPFRVQPTSNATA